MFSHIELNWVMYFKVWHIYGLQDSIPGNVKSTLYLQWARNKKNTVFSCSSELQICTTYCWFAVLFLLLFVYFSFFFFNLSREVNIRTLLIVANNCVLSVCILTFQGFLDTEQKKVEKPQNFYGKTAYCELIMKKKNHHLLEYNVIDLTA